MKKILTTIFFVTASFVFGAPSAFALSVLDTGGSWANPLYIQVQQDPLQQQSQRMEAQRSQNQQKENYLKSTYGVSNYYSCSSDRSSLDLSDPHSMTQYLSSVQSCLELKQINANRNQGDTGISKDVLKQAMSMMQAPKECQDSLGVNSSWDGTVNAQGAPVCGCKTGYKLSGGACTAIQSKPQSCDSYGVGSVWTESRGCDCSAGYEMNYSVAQCQVVDAKVNTASAKPQVSQIQASGTQQFSRTLSVGSRGDDVTALQQILISGGFLSGTTTGFFGQMTKAAVSAYQKQNGMEAVGVVGPKSRALLNREGR